MAGESESSELFGRRVETGTQRTVFFIAYHYPPIQSIGVERTVKFLRYLPEFGYQAWVLTTSAFGDAPVAGSEAPVRRAWEPLALYRWLFNRQVRSGQASSSARTDPGPFSGMVGWLRRYVLIPDGQLFWLPAALVCALRALRTCPAEILYSTYPPASSHLLGILLKKITGLPWVADFRDAWTCDPLDPALVEIPCRRALERRLEQAVIRAADAAIAATELSAAYLRQAYPAAAPKIQVITNGFDPEDFRGVATEIAPPLRDPLRIVHTGSFSRSHPQRTPRPLFAALASLLDEDPAWARRLRLTLVGRLSPAEQEAAVGLVRAGIVELTGPQERGTALAFQAQAHVLLLVDHPRPWPATNVPGKFYEYLAMQRPILALSGPGMVARLLDELGAGYRAPVDDPPAIRRTLVDLYAGFHAGRLHGRIETAALRPFHRRALTHQLALCFDRVLAAGESQGR
jgi:glycosyltransferase involved in cell wall biosynthesis